MNTPSHSIKIISWLPRPSLLFILGVVLVLLGCDTNNGEREGGTIGTGIIIQGVVQDTLLASGSNVDTFSADGMRDVIAINNDGTFYSDTLKGEGPWLLRVQIDSQRALYSVAYGDGARNINSFSDAGLRRALAQQSLNPESIISSSNRSELLPSSLDYDESVSSITNLVDLVLQSYSVSGDDLVSTPYDTNGMGIDLFLKRNNVVIENNLISFQVTDPATNIQTTTRTATTLTSNLVDSGEGPSQPTNIRALNGGMNDIVIVWEPSIDDINVAGYVVLRDNVIVGNTPYPQFIDVGLNDNQTYSYVITALDSAGNSSVPSLAVSGSTTQPVPSIAPELPSNLSLLSATSHSVRLSWSAPANSAVVSYNLYRGIISTTPTLLQQVSSTTALDTAVALGVTYCYQVSAIDVVGQESERSDVVCAEAVEENISSNSTVLLSDWNIPNTDVNCSSTLTTNDVPVGSTVLSASCYSVPQTLVVRSGATLQIDEGTLLKFGDAAKITVEGTLSVLGSPENPVVFTGETDVPGAWGGVEFAGTRTENNILRGAVIQYGGGGDVYGAVSTRFDNNRFSMEDTLVQYSEGLALHINSSGLQLPSFDGNLFFANENVGIVVATAAQSMAGSTRYIDNTPNELSLGGIRFDGEDIVIPNVGVPISTPGMMIENGSLTILPGANVQLVGGSRFDVDGATTINGLPDQPITLGGRLSTRLGAWDGLLLRGGGNKIINYVNITEAGAAGADRGAIEIDCTDDSSVNVSINNTDISSSASWGIYHIGGDCAIEVGDTVTYSNNQAGDSNVP